MNVVTPSLDANGLRIALVVSRFNHLISIRLIDGAREALLAHGARPEDLTLHWVAGAFEIPQAARCLASKRPLRRDRDAGLRDPRRDAAFRLRLPRRDRRGP